MNDELSGDDMKVVFEERTDPRVITLLEKIGSGLAVLFNHIKSTTIQLPKIFQVKGDVDINSLPSVEIENFKEIEKYFIVLEKRIGDLIVAVSNIKQPKIEFPRIENQKIQMPILDTKPILNALEELKDIFNKSGNNEDVVNMLRNVSEGIGALYEKPTFVPPAVTNVNINALQGFVHTTSATIGTTPGNLPGYGQLFNRRSVIIYNNSANTIYVGGSDVTTNNGMPVPSGSYSPILDAGYNMTVYGIASQGGNNIRVLEVSKDQTANVQE